MKTAVVGASGYAGGELLRLISTHPKFQLEVAMAGSSAGLSITSVHPHLQHLSGEVFEELNIAKLNNCDLIFLALPHGESGKIINQINAEIKVVDLGADFRLESAESWNKYYGGTYAGSLPYGLPELADKGIYKNSKISNPGCYATAIALGTAPLLNIANADTSDIVVVAASGTTGAGRSAKINLLASEVVNNLSSYKFGGVHQHTPEIEQILSNLKKSPVKISFTPILAPMPRGILATITVKTNNAIDNDELRKEFSDLYKDSKFIKLLPEGELPNTSAVNGTNEVHMQVAYDAHAQRIIISVAIDNLGKGAAGQAIQNANLICGFAENLGLNQIASK
jgi:N-acetyl-gamma-glutamyl-phosphate reductase